MYLNLASYLFTDLSDLPTLREEIRQAGINLSVRGTVLLAPEGINAFFCGLEDEARAFAGHLQAKDGLGALAFKESWSERQSFNRLLVKVKKEIITFRQPGCRPAQGSGAHRGRHVARPLARSRNRRRRPSGRHGGCPQRIRDTGGAVCRGPSIPALLRSRSCPRRSKNAVVTSPARRIVTYCTGGIRCEKAALHLKATGYEHVVQLEGGVLKYFEEVGGRHWEGELFVFDKRVSLKPDLTPGTWEQDYSSREIRPVGGSARAAAAAGTGAE
jgi:UPF0176 protein